MANELCCKCKRETDRNGYGLTLKFFGYDTQEFYCSECLALRLGFSKDYLEDLANRFKAQGCSLFN